MNRRFVLLLALFVSGILIQQAILPPLEFPEEHLHLNYVELLRAENRLPDRAAFLTNSTQRESGQPPLVYWLAGLPLRLLNLPPLDGDAVTRYLDSVKNPWYTAANLWNRADNMNFYLHGADERGLSRPDVIDAVRVLRLTMIVWGVLAVIGAYGAAREVFFDAKWALTAAALFAFTPTMIHLHVYFNNDAACVALATLVLWQCLVLLRCGATTGRLLAVGTLLGLAGLAKVSALLVAPGIGVAVLLDAYRRRLPFGRLILNGLWVGLPVILLFGPWAFYGAADYGDPFGFGTHHIPGFYHDPLLGPAEFILWLPWVYLTYWGLLGTLVLLNPITYTLLGSILLLAAGGYAVRFHHKARKGRKERGIESLRSSRPLRLHVFGARRMEQALVLAAFILPVFAGLIRWLQEILFIPGRLLYPAHAALVIVATGGLALLARRFSRLEWAARGYAVGLGMCAGLLLAPAALLQAYAPPRLLSSEDLPALQGEPLDFDGTIRLLGYVQPDSTIRAGGLHRITLCWEVLQPTDRLAAYSVKLVRDGAILADRTSVHGLGHYDSSYWRAGDRWCEDVDIRIEQTPPGEVYGVLLALLDARTQDFDWQAARSDGTAVAFPFIAQAISPAGDMSGAVAGELTPADIAFPGFADLAGYVVQGALAAGETVRLDLLWDVTGKTPDDWSQFVHLIGPASAVVLADGVPRAGVYPTWAWSVGERVADSWTFTLPADLPPGDYTLALGFYRQDTGERMPVQVSGQLVPDGTAALLRFVVE